jgi:peroxiredoxin
MARAIRILGTSVDKIADNAAFVKKFGYPFPLSCEYLASDWRGLRSLDDLSAARACRISYLIEEQGTIARLYDHVVARERPAQF